MNSQDCFELLNEYLLYLTDEFTVVERTRDYCHVITPFWRPDGDHIEVFAFRTSEGNVRLSDEGQTFDWLFAVGMEVESSETRQRIVSEIVSRYGFREQNGVISGVAGRNELGSIMHRFVGVLNSISHLVLSRTPRGKTSFKADVETYLIENNQVYQSGFNVRGKAIEHKIDFYLNSNRNWLVETLTATSFSRALDLAQKTAFKWIDIRAAGWDRYQMVTVLDDTEDKGDIWQRPRVRRALTEYSNFVLNWTSERGRLLGSLASSESQD